LESLGGGVGLHNLLLGFLFFDLACLVTRVASDRFSTIAAIPGRFSR